VSPRAQDDRSPAVCDDRFQRWQRISYHPHVNGGGPTWNPNTHGLHTYLDELLTWLATVR